MKLKKLIVAGVMCLSIVSLASCNKEKLAGTELAKILLAQERLDSENVKNTGNLFSTGAKALKRIEKDAKDYNENVRRLANKKEKPRTEVNGNTIRWYNDEEYSNMGSYFENYSSNIESMAKQSGDLIDYVKNNIRVTDKWIKNGSSEVLLQVDFESETIFERIENQYEICRRYTNDHGLDVYDIFRYTNLHDSKMRMKYIPGQVYEFAMSADWATYYLIANCFDGEWTIMTNTRRYGTSIDTPDYFNENFDIISLKDDIGLRTHMTVDGFNGERGEVENFTEGDIKLMSSDAKLDLFDMEDSYNFTIKNTSVNGIDYFEHSGVITEDHNNVNADILKLDGGTYTSITPPKVILKNGMILKTGDKLSNGKFEITNLNISNFAGMESVGEISFKVNTEEEPSSLFAYLYEFMDVCGLSFKREKDAILSVENLADVRAKNFINNFRWNGYSLNNKDNIIAVFNLEDKKITDLLALYEGVKNNPSISKSSQAALDKNVVFPNTTLKSSNVLINNRTVSVSNIEVEVEGSTLFEDSEKYKLSVGLAKEVNGEVVDFIPMYNCGEFTLSQSYLNTLIVNENIEFTLPDLEDGKFILSSTIVTEEGIRVSKPVALNVNVFDTFETSAYGYLNSYKFVDNTLVIETSLDSTIYLNINKEVGLTYLRNEMISYAIKRGDVNDNTIEQLADGNWAVLKDVDKLPNGQYRMKYVVDGKEEYVYANIIIGG